MPLKVLIVDPNPKFRELLSHHVTAEWSDGVVIQHDPTQHGKFPAHFSGGGSDVVLLGQHLGKGFEQTRESGLDWLKVFKRRPGFPPVVFLADDGDELLAVQVIKSGAEDYIPKRRLNHSLLINSIKEAVRKKKRAAALFETTPNYGSLAGAGTNVNIKGYEIIKEISNRGVSWVYLARNLELGVNVVLKVLRQVGDVSDGKSALERFIQEYEVISKVKHPNVVEIYGHGIADDHAYIAMEFFEHGDLKARMKKAITIKDAIRYATQMAEALQVIHSVGVLHRDLKPANVMLREDDTVALIDFGLAKETALHDALTDTGEVFGTPYYMSPEQGHADAVDERGDLYSLGVILYEMLTKEKPFTASTPMGVIYKHSHAPLPKLVEDLQVFQPIIDKLLAKEPRHRYQSAKEFAQALREIPDGALPKDESTVQVRVLTPAES
ncbi:MAG: protein kinase [Pseudomonadota bacterium]